MAGGKLLEVSEPVKSIKATKQMQNPKYISPVIKSSECIHPAGLSVVYTTYSVPPA